MPVPKVLPDELLIASQDLSVYVDSEAVRAWLEVFDQNWRLYADYEPFTRCQLEQTARMLRAQLKKLQPKEDDSEYSV